MKILVINGPNLNFLGIREKSVYGNQDYAYLLQMLEEKGKACGHEVITFQSNYEGGIIDRLQEHQHHPPQRKYPLRRRGLPCLAGAGAGSFR